MQCPLKDEKREGKVIQVRRKVQDVHGGSEDPDYKGEVMGEEVGRKGT